MQHRPKSCLFVISLTYKELFKKLSDKRIKNPGERGKRHAQIIYKKGIKMTLKHEKKKVQTHSKLEKCKLKRQ